MQKRIFPRVVTQIPAVIDNGDGLRFRALALDASSEGLSIQCSVMQRNMITPGGSFVRNGKPVELFVQIALPIEDGNAEFIDARCHVAFSRRLSRDICQIGMRYAEISQDQFLTLMAYIEENLSDPVE